jgi:hypothetical protein
MGHAQAEINYMGLVEKRSRPAPWEISAMRRHYQLQLMRARMEMEEILGR